MAESSPWWMRMMDLLDAQYSLRFPSVRELSKPSPTLTYFNMVQKVNGEIGGSKEGEFYADFRSQTLVDIQESLMFMAPEYRDMYSKHYMSVVTRALDTLALRYASVDEVQETIENLRKCLQ